VVTEGDSLWILKFDIFLLNSPPGKVAFGHPCKNPLFPLPGKNPSDAHERIT